MQKYRATVREKVRWNNVSAISSDLVLFQEDQVWLTLVIFYDFPTILVTVSFEPLLPKWGLHSCATVLRL